MPKYIKIKNESGEGELVLRTKEVLKVEDKDKEGLAVITYGDRWRILIKTASTAAEVLEAMEGKQGGCPTHFVFHRSDGVVERTPIKVAEPSRPTRCVTYSTYSGGKMYELSLGPDGATAGYRDLEQEVNAKPPVSTPKRFVVRRGSNDWRVYNTKPLEGDDGCDGIFITRERAEEYAASRERETAQHGTGYGGSEPVLDAENSCFCTNFAGQNSKCPTHGIGTAWRDLHGE